MKTKKIIVQTTGSFLKKAMKSMELAFKGNEIQEKEIISFTSIEDLTKTLSKERLRLINVIKNKNPKSIRELARLLNRNYKNVYSDIKFLEKIGLIKQEKKNNKTSLFVDYDKIEININISFDNFNQNVA